MVSACAATVLNMHLWQQKLLSKWGMVMARKQQGKSRRATFWNACVHDEHKRVTSKLPPPSSIESLDGELQRCGAEISVNLDTCPFQWWKMHPSKRVIESVK